MITSGVEINTDNLRLLFKGEIYAVLVL